MKLSGSFIAEFIKKIKHQRARTNNSNDKEKHGNLKSIKATTYVTSKLILLKPYSFYNCLVQCWQETLLGHDTIMVKCN